MLSGQTGYVPVHLDNKDWYVFYKPFDRDVSCGQPMENLGWSAGLVYLEDDYLGSYNFLLYMVLAITILGILVFFVFFRLFVRHQSKPLRMLTRSAQRIAEGNYDEIVPNAQNDDEIGQLQDHFQKMQQSLAVKVEELEQLTKRLQQRNEDLRKAFSQAQGSDRMKATFLHYMTTQMAVPADKIEQIKEKQSFLCVGLHPDIKKIPQCVIDECKAELEDGDMYDDSLAIMAFNQAIIDATAPYCVAYKPNLAFYESLGSLGVAAYEETVAYLHENYPHHFVIADAKRGDIGNTSKMYARSFFEGETQVDAVTVAPYMGEDSVSPFLEYDGKWVVLLALTSNKGSHDFQLTEDTQGERLFEKVLKASQQWGSKDNLMYVVGATQGKMFEDIRKIVPEHFLLVPGVGAQGGSLQEVCKYGMTKDCGLLVNSSRGIIYASNSKDFAEAAAAKARELQQEMAVELEKI